MEITELKCPCCGADIPNVDGMDGIRFCLFCGTKLSLDYGAQEVHIVDEAKLAEIELQNKLMDEKQAAKHEYIRNRRSWNIITTLIYIICFSLIAYGFYDVNVNDEMIGIVFFLFPAIMLLILPPVLAFKHPIPPKDFDELKAPKRGAVIALLYFISFVTFWFAVFLPVAIVEG